MRHREYQEGPRQPGRLHPGRAPGCRGHHLDRPGGRRRRILHGHLGSGDKPPADHRVVPGRAAGRAGQGGSLGQLAGRVHGLRQRHGGVLPGPGLRHHRQCAGLSQHRDDYRLPRYRLRSRRHRDTQARRRRSVLPDHLVVRHQLPRAQRPALDADRQPHMSTLQRCRDQRGFTLAELLVVCALIGVVMAGILSLLVVGQQSATRTSAQVDAQQNARMGIERLIEEVRESGYLPGGPTCPTAPVTSCPPYNYVFNAITAQTASSLTLQSDWDGSATITAAAVVDPVAGVNRGEQVVYTYTAGTGQLTRQEIGVDGAPVVIAAGITTLAFTYLDQANNVTATSANIRTVTIAVTTQQSAGQPQVTMAHRVRLRNRPTS